MNIVLPDKSSRELPAESTGFDLAKDIGQIWLESQK